MSNKANFYDLLGVDRGATTAEIRTAYIELMKRHHPDISPGRCEGSEPFGSIADLNAAFAVLRDHRKRAEYDMRLSASSFARPLAVSRLAPSSRHGRRHLLVRIATGAMVAGAAAVPLADPSLLRSFGPSAQQFGAGNVASGKPAARIDPDPAEAGRMVAAAIKLPQEDAVRPSRRCFADALGSRRLEASANCVVFDNAVLLWNGHAGYDGAITPYFQLRNARSRHLDALAGWSIDRDEVLDRLWSTTLELIVDQVRATPLEPPSPKLVAQVEAGVPNADPAAGTVAIP